MGTHGVVSANQRSANSNKRAERSTVFHFPNRRAMALRDWPVSWRLLAVIVLALVMGLVFGGLRVAAATGSAAQFGRVAQLANLGQQVTSLVQALEDERDETTGVISGGSPNGLGPFYNVTNADAARVQALAAGVGGSFPANIQASVATVRSVSTPSGLKALRSTAQTSGDALAAIADYKAAIGDMITLNDQIAQGTSDPTLVNDVRTLSSLSLAKDQAAQQRALLFHALTQQFFGDGELPALTTALSEELGDKASFVTTATPAEQSFFTNTVAGQKVNEAEGIEDLLLTSGTLNTQPLGIPANRAPTEWYQAMSSTIDRMQTVELDVAGNIVARSHVLQQGAEQSALITAILTVVILLIVLIATLVVARSLVLPLRRLRAGALDIATVQLPERVRQLAEAPDPATSLEVAPIDVPSADEIGQVARAFDQVHSEAVRLAGNEAMLRSSFNAMFVNLSRRSQSLIERLVAHDRLPRAERGRSGSAVLPVRDGPPRHPDAPELREPSPARRTRQRAQVERTGVARGRGPGRDIGDRAVRPGDAEHSARGRDLRASGIRRGAPARRAHRERHDIFPQGHPGARVSPGTDQRGRADRGQRQRRRHFRSPARGDERPADQSAGD